MGIIGVPLHVLTEITPMIVMIISISDTAHIVTHFREALAAGASRARGGRDGHAPTARCRASSPRSPSPAASSALAVNDMTLIQQFGLVTAAGVLFTWLANMTVLPLVLLWLPRRRRAAASRRRVARWRASSAGLVDVIERVVTHRPRQVARGRRCSSPSPRRSSARASARSTTATTTCARSRRWRTTCATSRRCTAARCRSPSTSSPRAARAPTRCSSPRRSRSSIASPARSSATSPRSRTPPRCQVHAQGAPPVRRPRRRRAAGDARARRAGAPRHRGPARSRATSSRSITAPPRST